MDNQEALKRSKIIQDELYATKRFLSEYTDKRKNMTTIQAFDNITADDESQEKLPEILKKILNSKYPSKEMEKFGYKMPYSGGYIAETIIHELRTQPTIRSEIIL